MHGEPIGEIGKNSDGEYYVKHYLSGIDNTGYESKSEAVKDLKAMQHSVTDKINEGAIDPYAAKNKEMISKKNLPKEIKPTEGVPTYAVVDVKTGKHIGTFRYGSGFKPSAPGYTAGPHAPNGAKVDYTQVVDESKHTDIDEKLNESREIDYKALKKDRYIPGKVQAMLDNISELRLQAKLAKDREQWSVVTAINDKIEKIEDVILSKYNGQRFIDDFYKALGKKEMHEAKYRGRTVPLGKPMKGDVKKKKVYVRKPNGNVVKVEFGDKKMRIKKSNPKRRKSFRARHRCDNPGPRWKARYWSCRSW